MKFSQVPVGTRFEFQGKAYVKSGPMVATEEEGGRNRFIARYADIQLTVATEPASPATPRAALEAETVEAAFAAFYDHCVKVLALVEGSLDPQTARKVRAELDAARAQFTAALAPRDSRS